MGSIRDRWTARDPSTGRKRHNDRWGKGRRWQARWVDLDGCEHVQACATQDEAQATLDGVAANPYLARPREQVLLSDYARRWLDAQLHFRTSTAERTRSRVELWVIPAFDGRHLDEISRADVQAAVSGWAQELAPGTVRVTYSHLTSMLKAAVADGLIGSSPCVGIRLPPKPQHDFYLLTTGQVRAIRDAMTPAGRSMVVVAAATGMRPSELRGLTWDRIDGTGVVTVDRQAAVRVDGGWVPLKTPSAYRRVPMGSSAWGILEAERGDGEGLVWRTRAGRMMTRSTMSGRWRDAVEGMGLPAGTGWHLLRHYHASLLIQAGLSPTAVAARLGHKNASETLATYAHLWPTDQDRAVQVVESELGPWVSS